MISSSVGALRASNKVPSSTKDGLTKTGKNGYRRFNPSYFRSNPSCEDSFEETMEVSLSIYEAIDTPVALSCALMLQYCEFEQLIKKEVSALDYLTAYDFSNDYQCVELLSKFQNFDLGFDRAEVAKSKFLEAESICRETNLRLRAIREGKLEAPRDFHTILRMASRKISRILGPCDLNEISEHFDWGPGATTSVGGKATSAYNKFSGPLDVTNSALVYGKCCINSIPSWATLVSNEVSLPSLAVSVTESCFNLVSGNEIVFVPKNAKTDRAIGIEPTVNIYLQKGFGSVIRSRLRRVGIDLNDQSRNQELARLGSLDGSLCTMDLSMASDTISSYLVWDLLPEEWFLHLNCLRSPFGKFRDSGEIVQYEKFSSMGNGFTFELESLIFYALVESCVEFLELDGQVSVYGDDLIFPADAFSLVKSIISTCGFRVNEKKSFSSGPFRESCGADYFLGTNVRPIFIRESLSNVESLYKLANSIRRRSCSGSDYRYCDRRFHAVWTSLVNRIPKPVRYLIPDGYGDGGLVANLDEARPSRARHGWEGWIFVGIVRRAVKHNMTAEQVTYVTALSAIGSDEPLLGRYTLRKSTFLGEARILTTEWPNLGPWE